MFRVLPLWLLAACAGGPPEPTGPDQDLDGISPPLDCDDLDPRIFPGNTEEVYNAEDDDCDPSTPDNDLDGDGAGLDDDCDDEDATRSRLMDEIPYDGIDNDCAPSTPDDDLDDDGALGAADCDDEDDARSPDLAEIPYDGVDNDCSGADLCDVDGDGADASGGSCGGDDCDDDDDGANPDAPETPYDGADNDCDAATPDDDLDGDGAIGRVDCDDDNDASSPLLDETPYDGVDNDCDPTTPDDDLDGDGASVVIDCDDLDEAAQPGGVEIPGDGVDNDCLRGDECDEDGDGVAEDGPWCGGDDCDDTDNTVAPNLTETPYDGADNDCDAATPDDDLDDDGAGIATDCDDDDDASSPLLDESPYDGVDNDCDAATPDDDVDGDGWLLADDCADNDATRSPDAAEVTFDGVDNDCDPDTLDVPNSWTFPDDWTTTDANNAEIPSVFTAEAAWLVVSLDDGGEAGDTLFHTRVSARSPNRILLENPEFWAAQQDLHLALYGDAGQIGAWDVNDPPLRDEFGAIMARTEHLHFLSSTTDETSNYYGYTCTTEQFQENRTNLPVDCRCNEATLFEICGSPVDAFDNNAEWGLGPQFGAIEPVGREIGGGFLDEENREYIVAMNWHDPEYTQSVGMIWAVDVDTGDRRIVSGVLPTTSGYQTFGDGYLSNVTVSDTVRHTATFPYLWDVQPGPDGAWYAFGSDTADNVEITRVDPDTGDRELVWHKAVAGQGHAMGQCASDRIGELSVQFNEKSFAMDPDGNFYLTFHNSGDGDGVAKISADGSTCTIISRIHDASQPNIGGGYTFQSQAIRGIAWINDEILAYTALGDRLIGFDPITGNRRLVSSVSDRVGDGYASIGERWLVWHEESGTLWTSGGPSDQLVAVDLETGDRQNLLRLSSNDTLVPGGHPVEHETRGPLHPGVWSVGRPYIHPDDPDHLALTVNALAMVIFEIHTSNSYMFSL
jgi:hypothetical protein